MTNRTYESNINEALRVLEAHPDYRVVKRILPRTTFAKPDGRNLSKGVIVDTETTGTSSSKDAIVELGMVLFEYDPETGCAYRILGVFNELEEPGFPIPAETTAIHGITDKMVAGKKIDDEKVVQFLEGVSIVIAHNSKFDRAFLEKRWPVFESLPWGCSLSQIDWAGEGVGSAKLNYIAHQYGFFYEAHRAEQDCFALLEILQQPLPKSGNLVLKAILDVVKLDRYRIYAIGSPYEAKDTLKLRGYRWDATKKCWHCTIAGDEKLNAEIDWLKSNIYNGSSAEITIESFNRLTDFSNRSGKKSSLVI